MAIDARAWEPHGRALLDYFEGDAGAAVLCTSSLGEHDELPAAIWFRGPGQFLALDVAALDRCRGRVLDVGAGAGVHSLALQERGFDVVAIDAVPEAVEILRRRGVRDARELDVFAIDGERFDTVLMLANGAGIAGSLNGLDLLFALFERILAPGGQVLIDSTDVRAHAPERTDGGYVGEIDFCLEYRGQRGAPFRQLYVDPQTFAERAARANFDCELLGRFDGGGYLVRLARHADRTGALDAPLRSRG